MPPLIFLFPVHFPHIFYFFELKSEHQCVIYIYKTKLDESVRQFLCIATHRTTIYTPQGVEK